VLLEKVVKTNFILLLTKELFALEQAMKAQKESGSITLVFL
jgi:hypothetical protein